MSGTLISGPMALGDPKHCVACRLEEGDEGDYEGEEELGPEVEEVRGHGQLHGQPGSTVCLLCLCLGFICLSRSTMPVTVPPQLNKISPLLACGPGLSVASVLPKHASAAAAASTVDASSFGPGKSPWSILNQPTVSLNKLKCCPPPAARRSTGCFVSGACASVLARSG